MDSLRKYINLFDDTKQINEEVSWQTSLFHHIFLAGGPGKTPSGDYNIYTEVLDYDYPHFFIPLVPSMIKRLIAVPKMYAFHGLGNQNIRKLISLQNQKTKQISVFTSDPEGYITDSGVWSGSGIVAVVYGDVMASNMADMMSVVDKKGTRVIDLGPEAQIGEYSNFYDHIMTSEYKAFWNDLTAMRKPLLDLLENYIQNALDGEADNVSNSVKYKLIKSYIDGLEPILAKHKKIFTQLYFDWAESQIKKYQDTKSEYDELVMGNFKIVKFIVHDDEYDRDGAEFTKTGDFCDDSGCIKLNIPIEYMTYDEMILALDKIREQNYS